jgi:phosphoribosyl-AMP cyclohydrolase
VVTVKPNFNKSGGLLPAIVQDAGTGRVLMLAYMNELAWEKTVETGKAHYWSRSRRQLWLKGETSGHLQVVREIFLDCDLDTILLKVEQLGGAACHTGFASCFYRRFHNGCLEVVDKPIFNPEEVYKK